MKTDALMTTRYFLLRSPAGEMQTVPMTAFLAEREFSPLELERLSRGLPVENESGRWADMVAIASEMFEHWDATP